MAQLPQQVSTDESGQPQSQWQKPEKTKPQALTELQNSGKPPPVPYAPDTQVPNGLHAGPRAEGQPSG